ncbi:cytochrome c oxidase subunit 4 [Streptomyces halstedii]|uniref:cytochrome-c oxidase n=1 Tax=Streptomyces halstedii TaxID=1944 RepID=A0A6N9TY53_STRHA|nr:cytochrome c oxidase subunit 4 [Streptomyces halstedii]MBV7672990.1 cytochrome c oxidase subunit 4 [Streptomyces halstedii]NEA16444.1 cytochrome c oxidase subunit 4 [Streptomyces halstedii]
MKGEAWLFTGVAGFFAVTCAVYAAFSSDPAGFSALAVSFLMSALIAAYLWWGHGRTGPRPEDRRDARVREKGGTRSFFPARSYYPVISAAGTALIGLGVVHGLWLFLIGVGVLVPGVYGFVFQNTGRAG